jgi:hypothetical protein
MKKALSTFVLCLSLMALTGWKGCEKKEEKGIEKAEAKENNPLDAVEKEIIKEESKSDDTSSKEKKSEKTSSFSDTPHTEEPKTALDQWKEEGGVSGPEKSAEKSSVNEKNNPNSAVSSKEKNTYI